MADKSCADNKPEKNYTWVLKAAPIVLAVVGALFKIGDYVSYNAYKDTIRDILDEYRSGCSVFIESLSDKSVDEDSYAALAQTMDALDRIAEVEVPNTEKAVEIDSLVAEEKAFLSDLCRCCDIAYSGEPVTDSEAEWVEQFTLMMREENKLYSFNKDINELLNR